jgi:cysteine desulfurase
MTDIYLDHAATTPMHPQVLEAMLPYFNSVYGNPSSLHQFGRKARQAITAARDQIADALHCSPGQIVFTSGGTESDNLAIMGVAKALQLSGKTHIITTQIEHHAVLHTCKQLEDNGFEVTYLPVDGLGSVQLDDLHHAIRPETALVSIMYGNNEVGTIQPIDEIGRICRERSVLLHVDAVQALGSIPLHLNEMPVDLVSFSGHKINGPKGIGLLYMGRKVPLFPLMFGGSQERKVRPGTENVAAIVGFAKAVELAFQHGEDKQSTMRKLRELFLDTLTQEIGVDGFRWNGHPEQRLEHIVNVSFPGIDKETMLMNLDLMGVAVSGGSACTSGSLEHSHVLQAMGLSQALIHSAIRFSFGYGTTEQTIIEAVTKIGTITNRLRKS